MTWANHIQRLVYLVGICLFISLTAAPYIACAQTTILYQDDFEAGISGWSDNSTTNNANTTQFLGRFDNSPSSTSRSFTVPAGSTQVEIEFDFYRFDSWDNNSTWGFDRFEIEIDGNQLFSLPFNTDQSARSGVTGNVTWSHTPLGPASDIAFNSGRPWYQDQFHRVTLTVETPGSTVTLLLRTALNQGGNDESGGYDNFTVTATTPVPDIEIVKTVDLATTGDYNLPGNDVQYTFTLTSNGAAIDANSIVLVDNLPAEVSLFTGDLDGAGQPVEYIDNSTPASGLTCCTAANIEYSISPSAPPVFGHSPSTPYDPNITYIRITPSGGIRDATSDTVEVELKIQAKIK